MNMEQCQKCANEFADGASIARFLVVGAEDVGAFLLCEKCARKTLGVDKGRTTTELDTVQRATVAMIIAGVGGADLLAMTCQTLGLGLGELIAQHSPEDDLDDILEQVQKAETKALFLTPDNAKTVEELTENISRLELVTETFQTLAQLIADGETMETLTGYLDKSRDAIDSWQESFQTLTSKPDRDDVQGLFELHEIINRAQLAHVSMTEARRAIRVNAQDRWGDDASSLLALFDDLDGGDD